MAKLKGRRSTILKGEAVGGMITLRMSKELHRLVAEHCEKNQISMNQYGVRLIMRDLKFTPPPEPPENV